MFERPVSLTTVEKGTGVSPCGSAEFAVSPCPALVDCEGKRDDAPPTGSLATENAELQPSSVHGVCPRPQPASAGAICIQDPADRNTCMGPRYDTDVFEHAIGPCENRLDDNLHDAPDVIQHESNLSLCTVETPELPHSTPTGNPAPTDPDGTSRIENSILESASHPGLLESNGVCNSLLEFSGLDEGGVWKDENNAAAPADEAVFVADRTGECRSQMSEVPVHPGLVSSDDVEEGEIEDGVSNSTNEGDPNESGKQKNAMTHDQQSLPPSWVCSSSQTVDPAYIHRVVLSVLNPAVDVADFVSYIERHVTSLGAQCFRAPSGRRVLRLDFLSGGDLAIALRRCDAYGANYMVGENLPWRIATMGRVPRAPIALLPTAASAAPVAKDGLLPGAICLSKGAVDDGNIDGSVSAQRTSTQMQPKLFAAQPLYGYSDMSSLCRDRQLGGHTFSYNSALEDPDISNGRVAYHESETAWPSVLSLSGLHLGQQLSRVPTRDDISGDLLPVSYWCEHQTLMDQMEDYRRLVSRFGLTNRYLLFERLPSNLTTVSSLKEFIKRHSGTTESFEVELIELGEKDAREVVAHVAFRTKKGAQSAARKLQEVIDAASAPLSLIEMELAGPRKPNFTLWVGNIRECMASDPFTARFMHMFQRFGSLHRLKMMPERNCAFVEFDALESAKSARNYLHGAIFGPPGKEMHLNIDFSAGDIGNGPHRPLPMTEECKFCNRNSVSRYKEDTPVTTEAALSPATAFHPPPPPPAYVASPSCRGRIRMAVSSSPSSSEFALEESCGMSPASVSSQPTHEGRVSVRGAERRPSYSAYTGSISAPHDRYRGASPRGRRAEQGWQSERSRSARKERPEDAQSPQQRGSNVTRRNPDERRTARRPSGQHQTSSGRLQHQSRQSSRRSVNHRSSSWSLSSSTSRNKRTRWRRDGYRQRGRRASGSRSRCTQSRERDSPCQAAPRRDSRIHSRQMDPLCRARPRLASRSGLRRNSHSNSRPEPPPERRFEISREVHSKPSLGHVKPSPSSRAEGLPESCSGPPIESWPADGSNGTNSCPNDPPLTFDPVDQRNYGIPSPQRRAKRPAPNFPSVVNDLSSAKRSKGSAGQVDSEVASAAARPDLVDPFVKPDEPRLLGTEPTEKRDTSAANIPDQAAPAADVQADGAPRETAQAVIQKDGVTSKDGAREAVPAPPVPSSVVEEVSALPTKPTAHSAKGNDNPKIIQDSETRLPLKSETAGGEYGTSYQVSPKPLASTSHSATPDTPRKKRTPKAKQRGTRTARQTATSSSTCATTEDNQPEVKKGDASPATSVVDGRASGQGTRRGRQSSLSSKSGLGTQQPTAPCTTSRKPVLSGKSNRPNDGTADAALVGKDEQSSGSTNEPAVAQRGPVRRGKLRSRIHQFGEAKTAPSGNQAGVDSTQASAVSSAVALQKGGAKVADKARQLKREETPLPSTASTGVGGTAVPATTLIDDKATAVSSKRCELYKQGQRLCMLRVVWESGDRAVQLPDLMDVSTRTTIAKLELRLSKRRQLFSVWRLVPETVEERSNYVAFCDYFKSRDRIGLLETIQLTIFIVPVDPSSKNSFSLCDIKVEEPTLLAFVSPRPAKLMQNPP